VDASPRVADELLKVALDPKTKAYPKVSACESVFIIFQGLTWAAIPQGSGIESVANYFCKRTDAKADWGYTDQTSYL